MYLNVVGLYQSSVKTKKTIPVQYLRIELITEVELFRGDLFVTPHNAKRVQLFHSIHNPETVTILGPQ